MKINLNTDQQIIEEAFSILIKNLPPSQVSRFWAICHLDSGDYSKLKDQLFTGETVDSLYEKIQQSNYQG